MEDFSVKCNLAVTTHTTINHSTGNFFSSESLNWDRVLGLHLGLKMTFGLRYSKSLFIVCFRIALKSSGTLPKYGKTKVNSFFAKR